MKRIILLIVVGGISGFIYICRNTMRSATKAAAKENTPRQVYEHDWAKQALDKMNKVVRDVREQIKDAQSP